MDNAGRTAIIVALITAMGVIAAKYIEVGSKTPAATLAPASNFGGAWRDQFGSDFTLVQTGTALALTGQNGAKTMAGSGTGNGDALTLSITNNQDQGTIVCRGRSIDPALIEADCVNPDGSHFDWRLQRSAA